MSISQTLRTLIENPPPKKVSLKDVVLEHYDLIEEARRAGRTWTQIAQAIEAGGGTPSSGKPLNPRIVNNYFARETERRNLLAGRTAIGRLEKREKPKETATHPATESISAGETVAKQEPKQKPSAGTKRRGLESLA